MARRRQRRSRRAQQQDGTCNACTRGACAECVDRDRVALGLGEQCTCTRTDHRPTPPEEMGLDAIKGMHLTTGIRDEITDMLPWDHAEADPIGDLRKMADLIGSQPYKPTEPAPISPQQYEDWQREIDQHDHDPLCALRRMPRIRGGCCTCGATGAGRFG